MIKVTIKGAAGSGKTTLANKIKKMLEAEGKNVLLLDGGDTITRRALELDNPDVLIKTKI